MVGVAQR